jgi:hypothetical protein
MAVNGLQTHADCFAARNMAHAAELADLGQQGGWAPARPDGQPPQAETR